MKAKNKPRQGKKSNNRIINLRIAAKRLISLNISPETRVQRRAASAISSPPATPHLHCPSSRRNRAARRRTCHAESAKRASRSSLLVSGRSTLDRFGIATKRLNIHKKSACESLLYAHCRAASQCAYRSPNNGI